MSGPAQYYLWWTTGCAVGFVAGLRVLQMRGALSVRTALALGWAWEGLILGAKWQSRSENLGTADVLTLAPHDLLEPGMRLPLGLAVGAIMALAWCAIVRAPWRETGDALAVAASALIPIGRIGCIMNGCCNGTVCPVWMHAVCVRFPPRSEAWAVQRVAGLIDTGAPASLPAHLLPAYFALASLAMLAVLVWLLRRGAPPGSLLLAFCLLRPGSKLALEQLRAVPNPSWLMRTIPEVTFAGALVVCAGLGARAAWRAFRRVPLPSQGAVDI